jgi:hypothetical protein
MQMDYTVWLLFTLQSSSDITHLNTIVGVQWNSLGTPQVENCFITNTKHLLKVNKKSLNAQKNWLPHCPWNELIRDITEAAVGEENHGKSSSVAEYKTWVSSTII